MYRGTVYYNPPGALRPNGFMTLGDSPGSVVVGRFRVRVG